MIETENLTRKFDNMTAVDDLSLRVNDGEVFGFLGPNGAGKTTTVRMLACLISKTSGSARIGEYEIGDSGDRQKIRKMVGLLAENVGLYEELSAYDNLDFYGRLHKCTEAQRALVGWHEKERQSSTSGPGPCRNGFCNQSLK